VLPAGYVAEHVELGYAVTAHRAQGTTIDTAHVLATAAMTREAFYVAMTRGRHTNTTYVSLDAPCDGHTPPLPQEATPCAVLAGVLRRSAADLSAHQVLRAEQDRWGSSAQLAAELDTVATVVERDRWVALLRRSGLDPGQVDAVLASDAFGPLCAALRRAESVGYNVDVLVPVLIGQRTLFDADDITAVLHHRVVAAATDRTRVQRRIPTGRVPRIAVGADVSAQSLDRAGSGARGPGVRMAESLSPRGPADEGPMVLG
jgi:hypothetical protein